MRSIEKCRVRERETEEGRKKREVGKISALQAHECDRENNARLVRWIAALSLMLTTGVDVFSDVLSDVRVARVSAVGMPQRFLGMRWEPYFSNISYAKTA